MFNCAYQFNQPIENWNVSKVKNMTEMFQKTKFNKPIGNWDVSKVTKMNSMFYCAYNFNQPLNKWNISNVTDIEYIFYNSDDEYYNEDEEKYIKFMCKKGWIFSNNKYKFNHPKTIKYFRKQLL